ncbi:hypothetical protein LCGC14_0458660 [marine sediment metagenome]|uniref:Uncharacterized protein n=1 Tax=marine sediment metagenome TaxID=412755 RepID=A0A0F9VPJ8_9ZZZZ
MKELGICPKSETCENKDRRTTNHLHNRCFPHPFLNDINSCKTGCYLVGTARSCPPCVSYKPELDHRHFSNGGTAVTNFDPNQLNRLEKEETIKEEYVWTGKELSFHDLYGAKHDIKASDQQLFNLMAWMKTERKTSRGYNLFDHSGFLKYALSRDDCFRKYLLEHEYIKETKDDKWNPKTGNWVKVDWKDIQEFQPGVMLNRVWQSRDYVIEITKEPHWNTSSLGPKLVINERHKNGWSDSGYREDLYYLSNLFNGKVYMKKV